jgi:molybdopterin molybdotransferase
MLVGRHIRAMDAHYDNRPRERQRIAHLTPLETALRRVEARVSPVAALVAPYGDLLGATVAHDLMVDALRPSRPTALIDGFAVRAEWTADAGPYAPALLPQTIEIDAGGVLPDDFDAVLPLDAVTWRDGMAEAAVEATAGDGVLMPGTDAAKGEVLRRAGELLRAGDVAAMTALGIAVARIRRPHIRLAVARGRGEAAAQATLAWLRHAVAADGGIPEIIGSAALAVLLAKPAADAIIIVGGTGAGTEDCAVQELAQAGTVEFHGVAISPGESAAFGTASAPVLLVPDRLDGALAAWLLIGRVMLARLRGATTAGNSTLHDVPSYEGPSCELALTAKVASTVGLAEVVLVRRERNGTVPLAAKCFPLASLARADGFIVVPAASEGFAPGTRVAVRPLP